MYQAYWGLSESPFRGNRDLRFFHEGAIQEEALARLQFLVEERRTLGIVLGAAGEGKSLLLDAFAARLGQINLQKVMASLVGLSAHDLLWQMLSQLGVDATPDSSQFKLVRLLGDQIAANRYQQIATVLLLDDADEARGEVLDLVARLMLADVTRDARLTVVLTAKPERVSHLGGRLLELAELRVDLDGWELDDSAAFVKTSLARAGRSTPVFSETALVRLHELAHGIPRRIKQLADLALLAGAGQQLGQIEAETIDNVCHELGAVAVTPVQVAAVRF